MPLTADKIAKCVGGEVAGNGSISLTGFAPAASAQAGDLTFAENESFFKRAETSAASAILTEARFGPSKKVLIRVPNARIAYAKVLPLFFPEPSHPAGIHPSAIISDSAVIDPAAHIGPLCVIGEGARIGARAALLGNNTVGARCQLGEEVVCHPNVVLYPDTQIGNRVRIHAGTVIGADGFGYVFDQGMHLKVPQIGQVLIEDDVEIGANVTIDRGALGPTMIGKGTKIDNLVQIAHNVSIGKHCIIVAQTGIAGSTQLGDYVTLAGQVGLAGHLKIGPRATVAAQSGVMNSIPGGDKWMGYPAQPDQQYKRQVLALRRLPEILQRFKELEKRVEQLAAHSAAKKNP